MNSLSKKLILHSACCYSLNNIKVKIERVCKISLALKIHDAGDFIKDTFTEVKYVKGIVKKYFLDIPSLFTFVLLAYY